MKKCSITWDTIDNLITIIAREIISESPNIYNIYGIPRGGLIPAVLLSHKLGIPVTQEVKNYSLIVDDISDSGNTLKKVIGKCNNPIYSFKEVYTATLFERQGTIFEPDFIGEHIKYNDWLVFPWEYQIHAAENAETAP